MTPITQLLNWFVTEAKPTQGQFAAWINSFWHKSEKIPMSSIDQLQETFNTKADKQVIIAPENITVWDATVAYIASQSIYRTYINPSSTNTEFHTEAIYRCCADTIAGQSPETNPEKWISQGGAVGTIVIESVQDLRAILNALTTEVESLNVDDATHAAAIAALNTSITAINVAIALKLDASQKGSVNGVATLGSDLKLAQNVDASHIIGGVLDISVIPPQAIERLVRVADQTARFALTTAQVQNGDIVKQNDTLLMYAVTDDTQLNSEAGYEVFRAGSAASVPWTGIVGKQPSTTGILGLVAMSVAPVDPSNPIAIGANDPKIAVPTAADQVGVSVLIGGVLSWAMKTAAQLKTWLNFQASDIVSYLGFTPLNPANNLSDLGSVDRAKANLGLDQVSNTSDANKPVSTAQSSAITLKENSTNKTTTITGNESSTTLFPVVSAIVNWLTASKIFSILGVSGTVTSSLTVGDFTGAYAGLYTEANWTNNFCSSVSGSTGDFHFGVGENGTLFYAYYSQSGWNRVYTNSFVNSSTTLGLSISNALTTSANWTSGGYYYNASSGDVGQQYRNGLWLFTCVDGVNHTWFREQLPSGYIYTTDITFLPAPMIVMAMGNGSTFTVPANTDIAKINAKAETTIAGTIQIGTAAGLSDVVAATSLSTTIGSGVKLPLNANYATCTTLYVTISSAATATLLIVNQKMY